MTRLLRFHLSDGPVEIHFPSEMTAEDVQDFEDSVSILMRSLRRWHAGVATSEQGAGSVRINGEPSARTEWPPPNLVHIALFELDSTLLTSADGKRIEVSLEAVCRLIANLPPMLRALGEQTAGKEG